MKRLLQDIRYAFSSSLKAPMTAFLAILSLSLGIGANTAIFSLINTVLLRPLDYPDPDRLVRVSETFHSPRGVSEGVVSVPNLRDWREQADSFQGIAAYHFFRGFNLNDGDTPVVVEGARLEPRMWSVLGVEPRHGRLFREEDLSVGGDKVAVLSYGLWQSRYGGDPEIVGREIGIDGAVHTVIGIMPESFQFPPRSPAQVWKPLTFTDQQAHSRSMHWVGVLARLKPEVALRQAQTEMDGIASLLQQAHPQVLAGRGARVRPVHDWLVQGDREALWTLWAAVGFVLLIACANVANLLLARSVSRRRELAVRAALGAGRLRIIRQTLSESLLLAFGGGLVGLALGDEVLRYLASLPGTSIPQGQPVELDPVVFLFCAAACLLTALLAGLFPAWRVSRMDVAASLKDRTQGASGSMGKDRVRAGLVVAEVALAVVVLVAAGLLLKSYSRLTQVDTGIDSSRLLTVTVPLSVEKYQEGGQITDFYRRLHQRITVLPGVEAVGMINVLPIQNSGWNSNVLVDGMDPAIPVGQRPLVETRSVGGDYFQAMGIPLLEGRLFGFGDRQAPSQAIVNKAFADHLLEGASPLGRRVALGQAQGPQDWIPIVGVVADVSNGGLHSETRPEIYFPFAPRPYSTMSLVVRGSAAPAALAQPVRRVVEEIDPQQPVHRVLPMFEVIFDSVAGRRFNTLLMGVFGLMALLLAVAGVYGLLSYTVGRRTYEFAVRMALGAVKKDVLRLVLSDSLGTVGLGIGLGLFASLWLGDLMANQLYGVGAADPSNMAAVCAVLSVVSLAAALIPARRAARVNPLAALRQE
ncbi:MAG TPA: ABC transporter permease [Acidobacteriota bacterium]|nr:ABC transporter permease [Acidobacteriota bacterium]